MIASAILFAAAAVALWWMFLRPVPISIAIAEVRAKTFKPRGTYWQQQVGISRGFGNPTPIAVDESCVLELYIHDIDSAGFFSVPTAEEGKYTIGQRVSIEYQRRGLPLFGDRTMVLSVRPR